MIAIAAVVVTWAATIHRRDLTAVTQSSSMRPDKEEGPPWRRRLATSRAW